MCSQDEKMARVLYRFQRLVLFCVSYLKACKERVWHKRTSDTVARYPNPWDREEPKDQQRREKRRRLPAELPELQVEGGVLVSNPLLSHHTSKTRSDCLGSPMLSQGWNGPRRLCVNALNLPPLKITIIKKSTKQDFLVL